VDLCSVPFHASSIEDVYRRQCRAPAQSVQQRWGCDASGTHAIGRQ